MDPYQCNGFWFSLVKKNQYLKGTGGEEIVCYAAFCVIVLRDNTTAV